VCVPGFDGKMHFVAESGVWRMEDGVFGFGRVGFDFVLRCSVWSAVRNYGEIIAQLCLSPAPANHIDCVCALG